MMSLATRLLLIDTCGETAGIAVCEGATVKASAGLPVRDTSASVLGAIRRVLLAADCTSSQLEAVGVVGGPGSFTGVRTGLATAKGLCESLGLRAAVVSRLEVLIAAAELHDGLAALDAGRGELYVRDAVTGSEWLCSDTDLMQQAYGKRLVVAEPAVAARLSSLDPFVQPLHCRDALSCVMRSLAEGGSDIAEADANYVRSEHKIYRTRSADTPAAQPSTA